jgi:hypothetical protein
MPARKSLLPVTTGVVHVDFKVKDWAKIDKIYATKIPDLAKAQIERITGNYTTLGKMELKALPTSEATETIAEMAKLAKKLLVRLSKLKSPDPRTSDTWLFLAHHLQLSLRMPGVRPLSDQIGPLLTGLKSLQTSLDGAKTALQESPDYQKHGQEWARWVRALAKIVRDSGLKPKGRGKAVSVNNDVKFRTRKNTISGTSAFGSLVAALQEAMPPGLASHTTNDGLSKAIQRALQTK